MSLEEMPEIPRSPGSTGMTNTNADPIPGEDDQLLLLEHNRQEDPILYGRSETDQLFPAPVPNPQKAPAVGDAIGSVARQPRRHLVHRPAILIHNWHIVLSRPGQATRARDGCRFIPRTQPLVAAYRRDILQLRF